MSDLEEVHLGQAAGDERRIDALLDVADEQESMPGNLAEEDDRDVVDRGAAVGRMERNGSGIRPEDLKIDVIDRETITGRERPSCRPGRTRAASDCIELRIPGNVPRTRPDHARLEDPANPIALKQQRKAGDVVLVGVAQDHGVQSPVPRR